MTNMMMNGAVAIYGGVGVMEIHQPLPQAVESVAQAVEDLAVNAHISLRELKNTVAAVIEKKLPKYAQLMEMHPVIAARTVVGGATLTAYENGYAVYEEDGAHTVMAINRCGDYRYDFNDGTYEVVPAEVFEDAEWSVRLVMEGERRMESNRSKTVWIAMALTGRMLLWWTSWMKKMLKCWQKRNCASCMPLWVSSRNVSRKSSSSTSIKG